ncbi:MAG: polysaccharide deacetylase [Planctomycetota bacterium]|nr:MAG: polysaccharide deacetylase [Planctomycetota bacterium]
MNKVALSIDIEDWYHGPAVIGSSFSKYKTINDFEKENDFEFHKLNKYIQRILEILKTYDVKATFFIIGDLANRYPEIVTSIIKDKHEIGCHGMYHYSKYDPAEDKMRYPADEFKEMTLASKKILEDQSGQQVNGYRAPGAYVCGEMIDILEDCGFSYDSSVCVNSIYKKSGGSLRGVDTKPYTPKKGSLEKNNENNERTILEFPWSYYKLFNFKFPTAGGPFLRFFGSTYISRGIKQSLKRGHTGFYSHAIDISEEEFPQLGKHRPFYFLIKGKMVEKRLIRLIKKFKDQISTYQEILNEINVS